MILYLMLGAAVAFWWYRDGWAGEFTFSRDDFAVVFVILVFWPVVVFLFVAEVLLGIRAGAGRDERSP